MENITLNDFSGGMVENVSPTDFSPRQWAELKGFVPSVDGVMESQWSLQKVGNSGDAGNRNFVNLHALSTEDGMFIFGVKDNGRIWFTSVGTTGQTQQSLMTNVQWYEVAPVYGGDWGDAQYVPNPNFRFLCDISFEAYKYGVTETAGLTVGSSYDLKEIVPAVLVGARVRPSTESEGDPSFRKTDAMYVLFMDPRQDVAVQNKWRIVSFPRQDRVPDLLDTNPSQSGVQQFQAGMLPYAYTDGSATLNPGKGVIPRANVATMWNNSLILGDVYWRKENSTAQPTESGNWKVADGLYTSEILPYEGSIMYSSGDIDIFDPRALLKLSQTGTELGGLHVLNNTLIAITAYGSENDGVIALRGDLSQLISYSSSVRANPFAARIEIVRGGMGIPSRYKNTLTGQKRMSCVWPDAGIVVFLDKQGGVFYTDSERVGRLDEYGPTDPPTVSLDDCVAAVGRHLFVYRDSRLFCLSMLGSGGDSSTGCWTEISVPDDLFGKTKIGTMVGAREEVYFLWGVDEDYEVWRMSLNCPDEERGQYFLEFDDDGTTVIMDNATLTLSTRTVAVDGESRDPFWHRLSFTFETPESCKVSSIRIQSIGAKKNNIDSLISNNRIGHKTWDSSSSSPATFPRTFNNHNEGEIVVPAGIGAQSQASATITVEGYIRLESVSFTVSGSRLNRGEVPS